MIDPIGAFYRIRDLYISYLETAFRIGDAAVSRERRALLETPGELCTEPIIELLPRYERVAFLLHEFATGGEEDHRLPGLSKRQRAAFVELALSGLFDSEIAEGKRRATYKIYTHQADMMRRGISPGSPGIVTSGTGSGKTEAFLLPVFAMLTKEALNWSHPDSEFLGLRWWQNASGQPAETYTDLPNRPGKKNPGGSCFRYQRTGERRAAAVRALVLYPMNALVEDQLSRLRKALDSDDARAFMDGNFNNNRVFLGKYTSATPVTGYHFHPRPGDDEPRRRDRSLRELFRQMTEIQKTQDAARRHEDGNARYLFPSVDGSEMISRWDMQEHPPDILITNVSMLSAMLAREVDAPIFEKTRAWIESDPNAYFFLILDELHLQRGSAGTEVSFLIRLLIDRLGLTAKSNRHKLRILASSASLPMKGEKRDESLQYLWDMFGAHGTHIDPDDDKPRDKLCWSSSVVEGKPLPIQWLPRKLSTDTFVKFLEPHLKTEQDCAEAVEPQHNPELWQSVCQELSGQTYGALRGQVTAAVESAANAAAWACSATNTDNAAPTTLSALALRLFGRDDGPAVKAVRGLLFVRGLGDRVETWFPGCKTVEAPSFRCHLFFRSIEGLFASADGALGVDPKFGHPNRVVGPLGVERGVRFAPETAGSKRLLELLYCECCGVLFFGGMQGKRAGGGDIELLPIDPNLDGLPDSASSQLFEQLSAEEFGIFWPQSSRSPMTVPADDKVALWQRASLDADTGLVTLLSAKHDPWQSQGRIRGYYFLRKPGEQDRHKRKPSDPGSSVPYACPSCGTDYSQRKLGFRLSTIRNFRTGFAKTTQLLATELFDSLRLDRRYPKLVSFSDSRQDAAKAALDIERLHHQDLRRQILVETLRSLAEGRPKLADLNVELSLIERSLTEAMGGGNVDGVLALAERKKRVNALRQEALDDSIPLAQVVETPGATTFLGPRDERAPLKPLLKEFVRLGVHPVDPTGTRSFSDDDTRFEWYELFTEINGDIDWKDDPMKQTRINVIRGRVIEAAHRLISEIIFNKTYFSLEETGLAYPCIPLKRSEWRERADELNAFLRVFSDAYRLHENPWEDDQPGWTTAEEIGARNRVRLYAEEAYGKQSANQKLQEILEIFQYVGHASGLIFNAQLSIKLVNDGAPFWRCGNCGRVHLHRGAGACTRCFKSLTGSSSGSVQELRRTSFLAKRIDRGNDCFRLRCDELTGQTDDPADRQRRFRGILLPKDDNPLDAIEERAREIDALAVTTTMEVGIDIGPLQATFQANMPPQRFNYQQRVGRAGRRGRAYSVVLTVCRSKSHDLYYFRHPEKITGDPPPPPFLTKGQELIALRLLRKSWLQKAFADVRYECAELGELYAGDGAKPDIHGEFVPTVDYFDDTKEWRERLERHLKATTSWRDRVATVLAADSQLSADALVQHLTPKRILSEIDDAKQMLASELQEGLAHSLAEAGLFPMFGMPTRVRNLYTGYEPDEMDEYMRRWLTVDRDLDVAIYEFAPGSIIVKDKRQHQCVGFTGPLKESFRLGFAKAPLDIEPFGHGFGAPFWLMQCEECGGWQRIGSKPADVECPACTHIVPAEKAAECRVPNGFRTDFRPRLIDEAELSVGRHRSTTAESRQLALEPVPRANIRFQFLSPTRTYKLNRGDLAADANGQINPKGFDADPFDQRVSKFTTLTNQHISSEVMPQGDFSPVGAGELLRGIWLAAPKTTDSLFIALCKPIDGLWVHRVSGSLLDTAVRGAAVSASFIFAHTAALELDIDPEEFDIVEPRYTKIEGGIAVPLLQITDHLVNGAGFCKRLASPSGDGTPLVRRLIRSIVSDSQAFPLKDYRSSITGHAKRCDQSCYICLQRYGNQAYHGLLDWRLGLSFLEAMNDVKFVCGLDGNFSTPSLEDWPENAERYGRDMVERFNRGKGEWKRIGPVTAFRFDNKQRRWAIVAHPLWDFDNPGKLLREVIKELKAVNPLRASTFDLARRPVTVRERLISEWKQ
jgi:DEAD/DEAH box helicase domain-containing protein